VLPPAQAYWQVHSTQAQQVYPPYYRETKVVGTLWGGRAIHLTNRYQNDRVSRGSKALMPHSSARRMSVAVALGGQHQPRMEYLRTPPTQCCSEPCRTLGAPVHGSADKESHG
jgi:hypothetical protein